MSVNDNYELYINLIEYVYGREFLATKFRVKYAWKKFSEKKYAITEESSDGLTDITVYAGEDLHEKLRKKVAPDDYDYFWYRIF